MESKEKTVRPTLVWLVAILLFFGAAYTLLSSWLVYSGSVPVSAEARAYLDSLSFFDHAATVFTATMNLLGAVALFLLRKAALYLFCAGLLANTSLFVWHMVNRDLGVALGGAGVSGALVGWSVLALVCLYAWRLTKSEVLT